MNALRRLLSRLGIGGSTLRVPVTRDDDPRLDPADAWAAAHSVDTDPGDWGAEGGGLPPNYVKSYDEGRPRK